MTTKLNALIDKATAARELQIALRDGSKLIQTDSETSKQTNQHQDFKSLLESRLSQYYSSRGQTWAPESATSVRDVELLTAREGLAILERIQHLLSIEDDAIAPVIGTRDLSQIRTLLSLVFKWGTDPLLNRAKEAWPTKPPTVFAESSPRTLDVSNLSTDYSLLIQITRRILNLILPQGERGKVSQSLLTTTLLGQYLVDVLRPSLALGWLPKSLSTKDMPVADRIRPIIMRLLSIVPTAQTIAALGAILSGSPPPSLHMSHACTSLLSRQILRQDGVKGLFSAVFGEEETLGGDVDMEKLEHISTLLNTVPAKTKPEDYFGHVAPRLIALLSETSPPIYRRVAAFAVSRMLQLRDAPILYSTKRTIIFRLLHDPLVCARREADEYELHQLERLLPGVEFHLRPDIALSALLALLSNADPSPSFISDLLTPITPALYSLLYSMNKVKTSDPKLKESLHGVLLTWGRIVTGNEGVETLLSIVKNGQSGGWKIDLEGHIHQLPEIERLTPLPLLTPDQVSQTVNLEDESFDSNIFDLYPDPLHFVTLLENIGRNDISSDLFVRLLEAYHGEKSRSDDSSLRVLMYLQLIMQMQKQLSEGTSANILKRPQQMLAFIHHVLESASSVSPERRRQGRSSLVEKLKIIPVSEIEEEVGDSDDDMPGSEVIGPDDELVETAINLLLSVLEADEDLSARTMPILDDIFSLLEPVSKDGSSSLIPLVREVRLVMIARLASTSQPRTIKQKTAEEESAQEVYQKALKLLQDPILPIRAHGLLLLRQLVTPSRLGGRQQDNHKLDPTLTPAIMSIFLQSVQDEDSYIFLNSVQGLAAMVDGFGREVLKGLIQVYAEKLDELALGTVSQLEVDVRTRVGEALSIVIRRCGDALGIYVDSVIPPLFNLIRAREIPTTLRTSAISLLADCVNTYSLAVLTYAEDLANSMVDLLQVETVPGVTRKHQASQGSGERSRGSTKGDVQTVEEQDEDSGFKQQLETMDAKPTSTNRRFPPLRRAALHFLGLLVKEATRHMYELPSTSDMFISQAVLQRIVITLGYISVTGEDDVIRVMAREVREGLGDFQKAKMGL